MVHVLRHAFGLQTFRQIQRGQEIDGHVPVQIFLHTYLQYLKIRKTVQKNLVMVDMYKSLLGLSVCL